MIKKIIVFVMLCLMIASVGRAEHSESFTITAQNGNVSVTKEETAGEIDYSQLDVVVKRYSNNHQAEIIYTGKLGGYDNGAWSYVDFSRMDYFVILSFENLDDNYIYIIPTVATTTNQQSLNSAQNLFRSNADFTLTSQIKINNVNVGEDGVRIIDTGAFDCTMVATNNSDRKNTLSLIIVTYTKEKKMYQMKQSNVSISPGNTANIQLSYKFDGENEDSAKIMLWDSLSGMAPIRTSIDFNQSTGINAYYYNSDNRLLQIDKARGASMFFSYDNVGNMLSRTITDNLE